MLASQRIESVVGNWFMGNTATTYQEEAPTKRGATPSAVEWLILSCVSGMLYFLLSSFRIILTTRLVSPKKD